MSLMILTTANYKTILCLKTTVLANNLLVVQNLKMALKKANI